MRPAFKGDLTEAAVQRLHEKQGVRPKQKQQSKERGGLDNQKRIKRKTCFNCGAKAAHPRSQCPAKNAKCFKCRREGHYGSVCKSKSKGGNFNELQTQLIDAPLNEDCTAEDYTPVYFTTTVHHLKTAMVKTLDHPQPQPHVLPLCLCKELSSQIFQISCEVDTGASCNILSLYKAKALFGTDLKLGQPTVNPKGYNYSSVENLGSCSVYLYSVYHGKQTYKVSCEVADSKGHMFLGSWRSRSQRLRPKWMQACETPAEAVIPVVQECTDKKIAVGGKTYPLPTTKEYLLREHSHVFKGIGTLPGGSYHIQLKEDYKPVQHYPRKVEASLNPAYKAESKSLVDLGAVKEVQEYTEWISSLVPVKKPDGSLKLYLDPKDLNKTMKSNQWYNRTMMMSYQSWQTQSTSAYSTLRQAIGTFHWTRRVVC